MTGGIGRAEYGDEKNRSLQRGSSWLPLAWVHNLTLPYDPSVPYKDPQDQKRAARRHYEVNKDAMKARASEHRKKHRRAVQELIRSAKSVPCADCEVSYPPYVMQFDHRAGEAKSFAIGAHSSSTMSLARIREEIEKCDVVCANCHAERTYQRGQRFTIRVVGKSLDQDGLTLF